MMHPALSREATIASTGFNRWLVPPAALAIHLSIGMAYGFSVFWLPLSKSIGITTPVACTHGEGFWHMLNTTSCDWKISMLGWAYTLFFVFLGSSAALFGGWIEHEGPRKAGVVAACCWCGGLLIAAGGVFTHQLWLIWLGAGVIGGIGLGLGYISPVSTLIKWFPDRRGMATGLAIMGFGGGAMIGAPLADRLMNTFSSSQSTGVGETLMVLALLYFIFMIAGALTYRVPPPGWTPAKMPVHVDNAMITRKHIHVNKVMGLRQFWLVWTVLCLNVTAGIGVLGMASPLLQEMFGGLLAGTNQPFSDWSAEQKSSVAAIAAGFTGLLSLFNILGRIFWASLSDRLGRKPIYSIFLAAGCVLYASIPWLGHHQYLTGFVAVCAVILSMYGGGFAAIPAYLADLFGTQMVSAIHGRLLTAWATAGVFGPLLVNYIREYQLQAGIPAAQAYDTTMYVLASLLLVGLAANLLIRPVEDKHFMTEEELRAEKSKSHEPMRKAPERAGSFAPTPAWQVAAAWVLVGVPLIWGITITAERAWLLIR